MKGDGTLRQEGFVRQLTAEMESVTDSEVKYNIYKALQRAAEEEAQNVSVERRAGKVILRGTARTWAERQQVEAAAWATPGVMDVLNEIKLAA